MQPLFDDVFVQMFNLLFLLKIIFNVDLHSWQRSQEVGSSAALQSVLPEALTQSSASQHSRFTIERLQVLTLIFTGR